MPDPDGLPEAPRGSFRLFNDTIAAIATASGPAGIGIIRISGPEAFVITDRLTHNGRVGVAEQRGYSLRRAEVRDPQTGEVLDDALLAVFHSPRSLTGEDVVEIQGHGGTITLKRLFSACLTAGARPARPGEFSERAFTAGKMDLAQAEAVADLINAGTIAAQRAALRQITGQLSRSVQEAAAYLKRALASIEASIDFPEEVGDIDPAALDEVLQRAGGTIGNLLSTAKYGRRLREGISVVLTGRPNVGKSSLLNALSGTDRAIVTPIPGTTRDIVEEALHLHGIPVRALDTAGIRETSDPVERIGVERARAAVASADVAVAVMDASTGFSPEDETFLQDLGDRSYVIALNKADLNNGFSELETSVRSRVGQAITIVPTSTVTGSGLDALTSAIALAAGGRIVGEAESGPIVTSSRHEDALLRAAQAIAEARTTLAAGLPAELIAVDVHGALQALGEITGETAREDIIASIFATFCIGK